MSPPVICFPVACLPLARPWPQHRAVLGKNNSFYRGAVLGLRLIAKKVFIIA